MRVERVRDHREMSERAALCVRQKVLENPGTVLGLATGNTPQEMYRLLGEMHTEGELDCSKILVVNLEEYAGVPANHPASFRRYMREKLFEGIGLSEEQSLFPNCLAEDLQSACRTFDETVENCGGIDLLVIGIGGDGHIGFHEPAAFFQRDTFVKTLSEETRAAAAPAFSGDVPVPGQAISLGLGRMMEARKVILLASGAGKEQIVRRLLLEQVTPAVPASVFTLHPDCILIADEAALGPAS